MLLVTNQLQYAPEADSVLYLEDGEMAAYGSYDEVVQNEGFAALLNEYEASHSLPSPQYVLFYSRLAQDINEKSNGGSLVKEVVHLMRLWWPWRLTFC